MNGIDAIRWGNPGLWWVLLLPVALLGTWLVHERFRRRVTRSFTAHGLVPTMLEGVSGGRRTAAALCVVVALELLGVAALRPRYGLKEVAVKGVGIDIAIVLDASRSMKVADVAPDRLGAAIVEVGRLLDNLKGNRVTLVPFSGIAFVQSPLTVDLGVIREYLRDLRVTDLPVPGTSIGRALKTARSALGLDADKPSGSVYKAIILLTDGENFEGEPGAIATELAGRKVRIHTVGVGTPAGQPLPVVDEKGNVTGTAREKDGTTPVLSKLNEDLLKDLATRTGGRYLPLDGSQDVAEALTADLKAIEKAEYEASVEQLVEDRFQYPLAAGLVLLVAAFLVGAGVRTRRAGAAALLVAIALPGASCSPFDKDHGGVDEALQQLAAGQAGDAAKALADLVPELPERPDLLYDLALARDRQAQYPEAIEALDQASAARARAKQPRPDWPDEARIDHARGTIRMHQAAAMATAKQDPREVRKVWRQAVEALSRALLANPGSLDTRRNLELAAVAAFPPCVKLDDPHEPNNTPGEAKFLTPDPNTLTAKADLVLCPDDADYFTLPLKPGETLFASVQEPAAAGAAPTPSPDGAPVQPKPARVDLALLDAAGSVAEGPAKDVRYRLDAPGNVLFRVTGPKEDDGIPYVLDARIVPACPQGDDAMEPSDSAEAAKPLPDGDHSLRICPGNEDWFVYTEKQGTRKQVTLKVPDGEGPLELEVFNADGTAVDPKRPAGQGGTVIAALLPKAEQDAPFRIRVFGGGNQGFYQLSIADPQGGGGDKDQKQDQDQKQDPQQDQQQDQKQDPSQDQDRKPEPKKPQPQAGSQTMRELLDAIDRNDENLEAKEALKGSPYRQYMPEKDW